jgi:beta-galactosidase
MRPRYGPTVYWCDLPVSRIWRCGNRGNVASVLIEKPARGNFLPVVDGGFEVQYSPLVAYREGAGLVVFCQLDVTGRTEVDPVAEGLAGNVIRYVDTWSGPMAKTAGAVYAGEPAGLEHLKAAGVAVKTYGESTLAADQILVLGPGADKVLASHQPELNTWRQHGGRIVALGLGSEEAGTVFGGQVTLTTQEYISAGLSTLPFDSPFAGVGAADLLNRDPRRLPLITGGARISGGGVLAATDDAVFCQLVPWQFDPARQSNLKRTFRRASFLLSRVLANQGVPSATPLLERFSAPVSAGAKEKRWADGFYLDQPEEWDDPYRFFRW